MSRLDNKPLTAVELLTKLTYGSFGDKEFVRYGPTTTSYCIEQTTRVELREGKDRPEGSVVRWDKLLYWPDGGQLNGLGELLHDDENDTYVEFWPAGDLPLGELKTIIHRLGWKVDL